MWTCEFWAPQRIVEKRACNHTPSEIDGRSMHFKAAALLESGALAFLGGITLSAMDLHDIATIASVVGVVLSAWGAKRIRLEKSGRKVRKPKQQKSPDNGAQ